MLKTCQSPPLTFFLFLVLDPGYQPKNVESRQKINVSKVPQVIDSKKTFSMILPPPNVTGFIHLGHCLTATVQDVVARAKRKDEFRVEWIPGTDHAGIATQMVVEKTLQKEKNVNRHDLGRQKFLEEVWKWKQLRSSRTKTDLIQLGTTLDWDKEYFTMDQVGIVGVWNTKTLSKVLFIFFRATVTLCTRPSSDCLTRDSFIAVNRLSIGRVR